MDDLCPEVRMSQSRYAAIFFLSFVFWVPVSRAEEVFRFPEGKHGKGELRYINGIPVLTVAGTPGEIGEQIGVLAVKPAPQVVNVLKEFLKDRKLENAWPLLVKISNGLFASFPEDYRTEV